MRALEILNRRVTQPDLSSGNRLYGAIVETGRSVGVTRVTQMRWDNSFHLAGIGILVEW